MNTPTLGIDMAQTSFVAALWFDQRRVLKQEFDNHVGGFRKLSSWLKRHFVGKVRAGVESTNTYADALLGWLYAQGHEVYLLNAEHVLHFGRSKGQRNRTDPADAATIAAFTATHDGTPWQPPPPEQLHLRSLTRARHQLVDSRKSLALQLRTATGPGRGYLQRALDQIKIELKRIMKEITQYLRSVPKLHEQLRHLLTIKGIGLVAAATAIAELPPITSETDPRTICGWAGLTPCRSQSGNNEWRTRLSRKGNEYLRGALYMPALVAKRFNPLMKSFALRLAAKNKTQPAIIGAISHKLLRIIVGLLRSNTDFDPNWSYQKH